VGEVGPGPLAVAGAVGLPVIAAVDLAVEAEILVAEAPAPVGNLMRTKEFLSKLEHDAIVKAIRDAESATSGKIRVFIQRGELKEEPVPAAQRRFRRLGLHKNAQHNDVLIFVAPRAHKFAIVGDEAIHQKCGDELWQRLVEKMREHFRNEKFSHALIEAIQQIGHALATHFPKKSIAAHGRE
jgi:uncharacterized membrane protein